jgi:putative tryptophan/tyrosine transport system substrate-binding protein
LRRRRFVSLLGGAAAAIPLTAYGQQREVPAIGFLHLGSREANANRLAGFRKGLSELGYVEGRNLAIEFRWAGGQVDRLPALAADLVRRQVKVIVTPASSQAALATKAATRTIPIVFAVAGDPIEMGLVASLNRPGGNATGISILNVELLAKRLELLRELAPDARRFAVLANPASSLTKAIVKSLQSGPATPGGPTIDVILVRSDAEIDAAFENMAGTGGSALLFTPDEFLFTRRARVIELAARFKIPTIYHAQELVQSGGLVSYGPSAIHAFELAGNYTARILKGEKPAEMPVVQSDKFELVINLKVAAALGMKIPESVLLRASEVIE